MRPCPHCFAQIEDQATPCPECGEVVSPRKMLPPPLDKPEVEKFGVSRFLKGSMAFVSITVFVFGAAVGWRLGDMFFGTTAGKLLGLVIGAVLSVVLSWAYVLLSLFLG